MNAQPTMQNVMSEIEAARVIEQELNRHREELRGIDRQFDELRRLRDELRELTSVAQREAPTGAVPDLNEAMHAVILALNHQLAGNTTTRNSPARAIEPVVETLAHDFLVEALTNIALHSRATESNFSVKREESWLFVSVFDNGKGSADPSRGNGLSTIRRRVDVLGGHFSVSSPPDRGTLLTLAIPCPS